MSDKKTIDQMSDEELSLELHRRRSGRREKIERDYSEFSKKLETLVGEFAQITNKKLVKTYSGYRWEDNK